MVYMPEQQNIEWKQIFGKNDKGEIVGVSNYQKLLVDLPNKISNKLGVICDINLQEKDGKHYIEIKTKPYNHAISINGKYYYRSGSTTQELSGNELNELILKKLGKTWDDVVEPNASLDDINEDTIKTFLELAVESGRLSSKDEKLDVLKTLQRLRLIEDNKLKRGSLLLFGKDPLQFYVSSFLKIGKFGKSSSELLSQEVIEGNLFELLDATLKILFTRFINSSIDYKGIQRIETFEYPYEAVREILLNAFTHRTYENSPIQISVYPDRIRFWNQGILLSPLTPEKLMEDHTSVTRNPNIARAFFRAGMVESWGRGTIKIIEECERAGLLKPKIEELTGGFAITLYKDKANEEYLSSLNLNSSQLEAIKYVKGNNEITNSIYQELCKVSGRSALRHLNELVSFGILEKIGENKGTKYILKK